MNHDTSTETSRVGKIKKLLAKAERAGTEAEARVFFDKAQDLMTKWAIDEAAVIAHGDSNREEDVITHAVPQKKSAYFDAIAQLFGRVGDIHNVKIMVRPPNRWYPEALVYLIGFESDVERVILLSESIYAQIRRERVARQPEALRSIRGIKSPELDKMRGKWRIAFTMAYVMRVTERLKEQHELTKQEVVRTAADTSFLPVLVDRREKVESLFNSLTNGGEYKTRRKYDAAGYQAGNRAANSADLGNERVGGERTAISG